MYFLYMFAKNTKMETILVWTKLSGKEKCTNKDIAEGTLIKLDIKFNNPFSHLFINVNC